MGSPPIQRFPPPRPATAPGGGTGRSRGPATAVVGAVVLLVALGVVIWSNSGSTEGTPSSPGTGTFRPNPNVPPTFAPGGNGPDRNTTTALPPAPTDSASAQQALRAEVAAGRAAVEGLVDVWVPQLSSKRPGTVADGITYDYPDIYANYRSLKARYPDALLVWSGDFSSFKLPDFWVTVVGNGYSTGEQANAWCDSQGFDADNCFAKRLSHTGGYQGNTLHRS